MATSSIAGGLRTDGRSFAPILALGLALRIAWALAVPVSPVSDSRAYDVFARTLAQHNVYGWEPASPSAFWPVGTSFVYSVLYRIFGFTYAPIVVLNILLGAIIVALTIQLARRWQGRDVAIVAGVLVACWPSLVEFTTVMASELPFIALLLGALASWSGEDRPLRRIGFAGVLLGAACYFRPTALLVSAMLIALSFTRGASRTRSVLNGAVVCALMALVIAPWSIRNSRLFDRFVIISTNGGANTWMGNNPESSGHYMELPSLEGLDEAERDSYLAREAKRYIVEHPIRFVVRTAMKLVRLHERESIGVTWNVGGLNTRMNDVGILQLKIAGNVFWWVTFAFALSGTVVLARRSAIRAMLDPALAMWAYFSAVHAVTVVQDRYHFPSIPFIAILAGIGIAAAGARWKAARVRFREAP